MDGKEPALVTEIKACRVCDSPLLDPILNFGHMPLANGYTKSLSEPDFVAPLEVVLCRNCACVQLKHTVDPKVLYSDYLYTSSTSGSLKEYFQKYAQDTVDRFGWKPGDDRFVVGIGGNDGPLEREYQRLGFKVLNVEPSEPIARLSRANRVPTLNAWFDEITADHIARGNGQADLITCNHCFAHMPDINGVMRAIQILLKPGGYFVFEEAYWRDTVVGNHFDQIYHEHVFYWTLNALDELFYKHGFGIVDVEFNQSQGGSIRVFVQEGYRGCKTVSAAVINETVGHGLMDLDRYKEWKETIFNWSARCREFLKPLQSSMDSISCYGAPAKFAMLSQQLRFNEESNGIDIEYVVEDSPIKVGRFTPGAYIPIVSREDFIDRPTDICIITAANYADLIVAANPEYKGRWIVLRPEPRFL